MQAYEQVHGPIGTDRLDRLVAHGLFWIGSMLGAVKDTVTIETFLPGWVPRSASPVLSQDDLDAKLAALPGAIVDLPDWAKD